VRLLPGCRHRPRGGTGQQRAAGLCASLPGRPRAPLNADGYFVGQIQDNLYELQDLGRLTEPSGDATRRLTSGMPAS
jgi:hypothetical protein